MVPWEVVGDQVVKRSSVIDLWQDSPVFFVPRSSPRDPHRLHHNVSAVLSSSLLSPP